MQRDRASARFSVSRFCSGARQTPQQWETPDTCGCIKWTSPSHADCPLPLLPCPNSPHRTSSSFKCSGGDSVCAWPVDTCRDWARGGVASAILLCFDSSRRCRVQYITQVALAKHWLRNRGWYGTFKASSAQLSMAICQHFPTSLLAGTSSILTSNSNVPSYETTQAHGTRFASVSRLSGQICRIDLRWLDSDENHIIFCANKDPRPVRANSDGGNHATSCCTLASMHSNRSPQ